MAFAELLGRSCFSFLRGASEPQEMVQRAQELGLSALALCDRDGLYGSVRALRQAKELDQRIIVGAELSLAPDRESSLALLVENLEGYGNLCRLLTLAHAGKPKGEGALGLDQLSGHEKGLVAVVPAPRNPGDATTPSDELLARVKEHFPGRGYLAVYRRLDGLDRKRVRSVERWHRKFGLEIVASARPLYHHPSRKPLADVVHCIRHGITLDQAGTALDVNAEAFLRSELQMLRLFSDHPDWVHRAGEVASPLHFQLDELRYDFPCALADGETADGKLAVLTHRGAASRYPNGVPARVQEQLEKELFLIEKLKIAPYFLSTWEVVEMARRRRILCQGRGSAANSAVCYVLGITAVDPARSNLLFERFISAERSEPPDIDIDFEHERREEVIQEIYERYGRDRAAMVSEVICYRGKSALREVGKVFGLSLEQVGRLSSIVTHWDDVEVGKQKLVEYGFDPGDERLQKIVALARQLQGFPRHLSIHVGGFVLSAAPLFHVAPVEPARMPDRTVIPWDKDDLEDLGFFKIDVLGLGMLTAIRKALALIFADGDLCEPNDGGFDPLEVLTRITVEDSEVYEMICRADTIGVFQIESRAQMAMLPRLLPRCFYDLVIEVAIVRPGPIQGGMVHPYLRRRRHEEPRSVPHPDLSPILERTLGVPLFQEQVMQIAIVGAGYSGGEADQLRRDMAAWKKTGKLLRHRQRLLDGFAKRGISVEFSEALFEQIKGFGDYGFPESHAASFALLAYASAWLKAHYPAHFACALLNSQPMGFYSPSAIIQDAVRHGVEVSDVDVTKSDWDSTLEGPSRVLRLGLRQIKGLGRDAALRIQEARAEASFDSLHDLTRRAKLKKDELDALAEAGALEALVEGRRQALWLARSPRVGGLFEKLALVEEPAILPALRASEQLLFDYGRKGYSLSDHPMRHHRTALIRRGALTAAELRNIERGQKASVAGLVTCRQRPGTASGVVFITLEDETGYSNLIVYRNVYEKNRMVARHATLLYAHGKVEREIKEKEAQSPYDVVHLIVESFERLDVPSSRLKIPSRDFH